MDLMDNIMDSIKYPLTEIKNFAILALIMISCILIIPIPLFAGYLYRIIQESAEGYNELPEFDDLGQMYIDGLKYIGVGIIYGIVVTIILFLAITIGAAIGSDILTILLTLIAFVIAIIIMAFEFISLFNMITEDNFVAAFDFTKIMAIINEIGIGQYVVWLIAIIVIGVVASGISTLLSWTLIVPIIANAWISCFQSRSMALFIAYD